MQGQFMPNVSRPQMTSERLSFPTAVCSCCRQLASCVWGVANPPVVAGNIQYGPPQPQSRHCFGPCRRVCVDLALYSLFLTFVRSYKLQYQKRSTSDKSAVKSASWFGMRVQWGLGRIELDGLTSKKSKGWSSSHAWLFVGYALNPACRQCSACKCMVCKRIAFCCEFVVLIGPLLRVNSNSQGYLARYTGFLPLEGVYEEDTCRFPLSWHGCDRTFAVSQFASKPLVYTTLCSNSRHWLMDWRSLSLTHTHTEDSKRLGNKSLHAAALHFKLSESRLFELIWCFQTTLAREAHSRLTLCNDSVLVISSIVSNLSKESEAKTKWAVQKHLRI